MCKIWGRFVRKNVERFGEVLNLSKKLPRFRKLLMQFNRTFKMCLTPPPGSYLIGFFEWWIRVWLENDRIPSVCIFEFFVQNRVSFFNKSEPLIFWKWKFAPTWDWLQDWNGVVKLPMQMQHETWNAISHTGFTLYVFLCLIFSLVGLMSCCCWVEHLPPPHPPHDPVTSFWPEVLHHEATLFAFNLSSIAHNFLNFVCLSCIFVCVSSRRTRAIHGWFLVPWIWF